MLAHTAVWGEESVSSMTLVCRISSFFLGGVVGDVFTRFAKHPLAYAAVSGFTVAHGLQTLLPDCDAIKVEYLMELSVHGLT